MAFKDRLKEARIASGLTQKQLAEKLGIGGTTVTGYEKGNSEPNVNTIGKIMEILHVDANFLWQDEMRDLDAKNFTVSEIKMVKKYRLLDAHGKDMVDTVLEKEFERTETVSEDEDSEYDDEDFEEDDDEEEDFDEENEDESDDEDEEMDDE